MLDSYDILWREEINPPIFNSKWIKSFTNPFGADIECDAKDANSNSNFLVKFKLTNDVDENKENHSLTGAINNPLLWIWGYKDDFNHNVIAEMNGLFYDSNFPKFTDARYQGSRPWPDSAIPLKSIQFVHVGDVFGTADLKRYFKADLNRDGKVNFPDYAVFAENYGRTDVVKGSNPNALGDYSDMTDTHDGDGALVSYGDGKVDMEDVGVFCSPWLFDINDPNT